MPCSRCMCLTTLVCSLWRAMLLATDTLFPSFTGGKEEEEMQSPGRAHPRHIPMVPAGPHRSGR